MQNLLFTGMFYTLLVGSLGANKPSPVAEQKQELVSHRMALADTSLNGEWFLVPVLPSDTAAGKFPSINFNVAKSTFTGHTGCNRMSGTFKRTDTSLIINERIIRTEMACPGYNEEAFIKTLLNTNRYQRKDSVLVLMFDQTELSRWTRKPYHAPMSKGT
jgi:heat shock protein HslJ